MHKATSSLFTYLLLVIIKHRGKKIIKISALWNMMSCRQKYSGVFRVPPLFSVTLTSFYFFFTFSDENFIRIYQIFQSCHVQNVTHPCRCEEKHKSHSSMIYISRQKQRLSTVIMRNDVTYRYINLFTPTYVPNKIISYQ